MRKSLLQHLLAAAGLLAVTGLAHAGAGYQIKLTPEHYDWYAGTEIMAINNHGDMVGEYDTGWSSGPYYMAGDGGARKPMRGGNDDWRDLLGSVNNHGAVALTYEDRRYWDFYTFKAQVFDSKTGVYTTLKTSYPDGNSFANDINDAGVVVGSSSFNSAAPQTHATVWINGEPTDLGTLGGAYSSASDINNQGTVIGYSSLVDGTTTGFLYQNGQMTALGAPGNTSVWASGINDSNVLVGSRTADNGVQSAFIYQNGVMTDLGVGANSSAIDINNAGAVLGVADGKAFIYQNGQVSLLDQLIDPASGWHIKSVTDINDVGQVGAQVCGASGACFGAILTPVPEPATYGMLLAGLGVIGAAARRRRTRQFNGPIATHGSPIVTKL